MFRALVVLSLLLAGCSSPELAPEPIDANLRWFWQHSETADEATLIDAANKLAVATESETRIKPIKGQMRQRLQPADLASIGLDGNDPSTARGVLVVNLFDCTLDKLEAIHIAADQMHYYPDAYGTYTRTFTSDFDAYARRDKDRLSWDSEETATLPIDDVYGAVRKGTLRRVRAPADGPTKGHFLVEKRYLTTPATFSPSSNSHILHDYEVEVFWEQSPGRIFHGYGGWRDIKDGSFDIGIEEDGFFNALLNDMIDWDTDTAALCQKM